MADPLTVLGTAASVVQLADVALRLSKELYGFFRDLKDSKEQFNQLVATLHDVTAAIQTLRDHVYHINGASNADKVPSSLVDSLRGLFDELYSLRKILPGHVSSLSAKTKWVFDKKRAIDTHFKALERRQITLLMHLGILGLKMQFGIQNTAMDLLNSVGLIQTELDVQSASIQAMQQGIDSVVNRMNRNDVQLPIENIDKIENTVKVVEHSLEGKVDSLTARLQQPQLPSAISSLKSSVNYSEDTLARTLRYELRRVLSIGLEQSISKAESHNTALFNEFKGVLERFAATLSHDVVTKEFNSGVCAESTETNQPIEVGDSAIQLDWFRPCDPRTLFGAQGDSRDTLWDQELRNDSRMLRRPGVKPSQRIWSFLTTSALLGAIRIEVKRTFRRAQSSFSMMRTYDITVHFWPSWCLSKWRGISLRYSTGPNDQGYYQICPVIATYPIIPDNAPVWDAVVEGDVLGLSQLFSRGLASPNDQNQAGYTLLHIAVGTCNVDICNFLVQQGADPMRVTLHGETPSSRLLRVFSALLLGLRKGWTLRAISLSVIGRTSQAARILQLFDSVGSDLEDSSFDIKMFFGDSDDAPDWTLDCPADLRELRQWANFLRSRGLDILQCNKSDRYDWRCLWQPTKSYINILLACGLNPNGSLDSTEASTPLLYALRNIYGSIHLYPDGIGSSKDVAISLIRAGADIYHTEWYRCEDKDYFNHYTMRFGPLLTPTTYAGACGIQNSWKEVLQVCGFCPEEVFAEDFRRRGEFLRSYGAERTGVEGFGLAFEEQTVSTLRHRTGFRRQVC